MSGKESRLRKVEIMHAHSKNMTTTMSILHIKTELVNTPTKTTFHIDIFIG